MSAEIRPANAWSGLITTGLGAAVMVTFLIGQAVGVIACLAVRKALQPEIDLEALAVDAQNDGTILSVAGLSGSVPAALFTLLFGWVMARDQTAEFLGLFSTRLRTVLLSLGAMALFVAVADTITFLLGRNIVPEFMELGYRSASFKPLFWFSICLVAPAFEELFFRGFLQPGWTNSRWIGRWGAILLTSLVWTGIHLQYGPYELLHVFLMGLMFGVLRARTGSVWPSFACHVLVNVIATTEAALFDAA